MVRAAEDFPRGPLRLRRGDRSREAGTVDMLSELLVTPNVPLPHQVYHQVRRAILNGFFVPGQMLRHEEVAAILGVSRSPLREALPRLEAEGMVVLHPRRGYAVVSLDPTEIAELFDLRILLEVELAR